MRYSEETIGNNAGIIWKSLSENPNQTISSIEKSTELKKDDLLLALGWLFKEGKIKCEMIGKTTSISLI